MRATMKISGNTAIDNILDNYTRLMKLQNQMAKGQRVVNPSDDPLSANEGIRIQTILTQIEQYQRNLDIGNSFLGLSDAALQDVNNVISTARALTVGMASDTTTPQMRRATVVEVNSLLQELVLLGNRNLGNRYIFGGTRTTEPPLTLVGSKYVLYNGNENDINVQVDRNNYVSMNVTAPEIFGSLITQQRSEILTPRLNLDRDTSTRLEDLNTGRGVAQGSINIAYNGGPVNGVEIDLTGADTLEDVADLIESKTQNAVRVSLNAAGNGLVLTDGGGGPLVVSEVANNTTARDLGIRQTGAGGVINGLTVTPRLDERTLLADVPGYYGTSLTIANGASDLVNPTVSELRDINNNMSGYAFSGLSSGVNTDPNNRLYVDLQQVGANYEVRVYRDAAKDPVDLVAVGTTANPSSTVVLNSVNSSGLGGSLNLTYFAADPDIQLQVDFPETFQGTVQVEAFRETNDGFNQLEGWQLFGLERGVDTEMSGNMAVEITTIAGQRTVRVYRDAVGGELVAQGSLAAGVDNGTVTLVGQGTHTNVSGTVNLQYLQADNTIDLTATFATVEDLLNAVKGSQTYTTARISDDGRAIQIMSRLAGATLHVAMEGPPMDEGGTDANDEITRWDIQGIKAGINSDTGGKLYAEYLRTAGAPNVYTVNLYSDGGHTNLVATGSANEPGVWPPAAPNELVITLAEAPGSNSGISGTVNVQNWTADNTTIELTPGQIGLSCQRREDNIFSTLNDVIDAALDNDSDTLHDLLGNFVTDNDRVLQGRAEIGARMERFEMLSNRLADESTNFSNIYAKRIDLDYSKAIVDFQSMTNIFNASLSVAGRIVPLSLVDFI